MLEAALPVTIGIAAAIDWPAAASGFAGGVTIAPRTPPPPAWYLPALGTGAVIVASAYGEELLRTLRHGRVAADR